MRIGILAPVTWRTPPRRYGPWEQVASHLAEGLVARGHQVTLFATGDSVTRAQLEWVVPRPLGESPPDDPDLDQFLHMVHAFRQAGRFDLIHNHLNWQPLLFAELVATPVVTTLHGAAMLEPASRRAFLRFPHRPCVAISQAERDAVPGLDYVATVPNGIELERFTFRDRPGEYLLFLARMHPAKGPDLAIEVARRTGRRLVMAAHIPPDQEAYFEQEIRPLIDGEQIRFVGEAGPAARDRLMGGALALLHLVRQPEPFGLTLAEAQACGTPVIGFDRGSVREVVAHGETGFVVETLERVCSAVEQAVRLSRAACRQRVERFYTVDRMVEGYLAAYERVLSGG
ncbi:glycosyl transferase [Limnochorda pilosa]|uniref:Glycosyl transferase n=1 Tax=Limnochorda pilosa TaxID=1555112 RepID=A0A0K2SHS7_LIMPI|nr:glycosyltransferase family 4 protein [Limnochorda pilosa]BAS26597.1 glycosyl transferase [Limnochorda pilosa]